MRINRNGANRCRAETNGEWITKAFISLVSYQLMDVDKDNSGDVDLQEFIAAMKSKYMDTEGPEAPSTQRA